jgi:hypothetical protein
MIGFKQLAYAAVMGGAAFAVNPTGKHSLGADSTWDERNRTGANVSGIVNPSASRADSILDNRKRASTFQRPRPAEPMPPTSCRSVEPVPKRPGEWNEPDFVHHSAVLLFIHQSGFGLVRMFVVQNDRGVTVSSRAIDRVELVSLLTAPEPSVYVLDEMATPELARQAKRRPLDEFERLGLDAVRRGEELVWTREAPTRMFGAIRADASCLECHKSAKEGDLLGAFTYYLKTPVDQLGNK